jgi:hypothetical protein
MADLFPITIEDQIASVEREINLRRRVYPRWVSEGKMKQDKADREIAVMEAVLETLKKVKP